MCENIFSVCLIAALLPCLISASSYTPCTTAEQCKSNMKHEFKVQYYEAFTDMLEQTLYAIEDAAEIIETALPTDDLKRTQLEGIKSASHQLRDILEGELNDDKVKTIYENTQQFWRQLRKINTVQKDIRAQKDRATTQTEKMYKALFDIWTKAGQLKGDVEVPGFDAIDTDVQKAKDTAITDENMEFIIGTFTRAMNFYELRKLNVFTYM